MSDVSDDFRGMMNFAELDVWLKHLEPQQIIEWSLETFGGELAMTSAFGMNGVTLIHMLCQSGGDVPVIFVDTGYLFRETLETKHQIEEAYGVRVLTFYPALDVEGQISQYGPDLPMQQPDWCCALRKVEPMQRALSELGPAAMLNGRSRFQSRTRQDLPVVEWDKDPIRINPLALWTQQQIEEYVKSHAVPYNPLHDRGYPSIGCQPCTRPIERDEHVRSGRWAGLGKTECGLWTTNYAAAG